MRRSSRARRSGRGGAYEFGRLTISTLVIIVLVTILLRLLGWI